MSGLICITIHKLWYAAGVLNVSYLICNSQKISTQIMRSTRTYHLKPQRDNQHYGEKNKQIIDLVYAQKGRFPHLYIRLGGVYTFFCEHTQQKQLRTLQQGHTHQKKKKGHVFQRKWKNNGKASRTKKKKDTHKTVLEHIKAQFRTKIKILNII